MGSAIDVLSSVGMSSATAHVQAFVSHARGGTAVVYNTAFASALVFPRAIDGSLTAAAVVLLRSAGALGDSTVDCPARFSYAEDLRAVEQQRLYPSDRLVISHRLACIRRRQASARSSRMIAELDQQQTEDEGQAAQAAQDAFRQFATAS